VHDGRVRADRELRTKKKEERIRLVLFNRMHKHNFRNLKIYQRAISFSVEIYTLSKHFPNEEVYGLTSQIRRASISISSNIAEGSGNSSEKEFKRFLEIAQRSIYEVLACLEIANKLRYCNSEEYQRLSAEAREIAAMITGFSRSL
jgi:four helix bundle protein